jgi:hypothetical protein
MPLEAPVMTATLFYLGAGMDGYFRSRSLMAGSKGSTMLPRGVTLMLRRPCR